MPMRFFHLRHALGLLLEDLDRTVAVLGTISSTSRAARDDVEVTRGSIQRLGEAASTSSAHVISSSKSARSSVESDTRAIEQSSRGAFEAVESAGQGIQTSSSSASKAASSAADGVRESADRLEAERPRIDRMDQVLEEFFRKGDAQVQSLLHRLSEGSTLWDGIIERMLGQVELGLVKVEDLLSLFGNAEIAVEDGVVKLRELLDQLDPHQYERQILELVAALRKGEAEISDVIEFLKSKNSEYARSLADLLRRVLEGKATLEDLRRAAAALEETFGSGPITALLDQLERELQAELNGGVQ